MGVTNMEGARVEVSAWDQTRTHIKESGEIFYVNGEIQLLVRTDLPRGTLAFLRMYSSNVTEIPSLKMFHVGYSRRARRHGFRILTLVPVHSNQEIIR